MDSAQFADQFPGELRLAEKGYLYYKPEPLPPDIEYEEDLVNKLSEANRAVGKLSGIGQLVSESRMLLLRPFIRREAVFSSRIEGTHATVSAVYAHEAGEEEAIEGTSRHEAEEVLNYVYATEEGLDNIQNGITEGLIKNLHEILVRDTEDEEQPGEYRDDQRAIGNRDPRKARFVPPIPHRVPYEMNGLVRYLQGKNNYEPLIDIALTHYQFETIHPFTDGNGRMGRLLVTLLLDKYDILPDPFLYFSSYFNAHRDEYVQKLFGVNSRGEWEEWIKFFLDGVIDQSKEVFIRSNMLLELREDYRERYQDRQYEAILPVIYRLFQQPITRVSTLDENLNNNYQSINNAVHQLEHDGVVEEVTGKKRYKVYHAQEILDVIEDPIETLVDDVDEEFNKYRSFLETSGAQEAESGSS